MRNKDGASAAKAAAGTRWMTMGLLLLAAALLLTGYNIWDEWRADAAATRTLSQIEVKLPEQQVPDYMLFPDMEMPVQMIDGDAYIGTLEVPVLDLSLPVMSEWSYPNLKKAPCRYKGSAYKGNLILAGHNYRTHFGGLKNLSVGDRVTFTDCDGNVFYYDVAEMEVLERTAIEEMEAGDWELTLFTCTYGGQSRVTVRCTEISKTPTVR